MSDYYDQLWESFLKEDSQEFFKVTRSLYLKWINILRNEIRSIFYNYKIKLKLPSIIIEESNKSWGKWCSYTKTVYLSQRLLMCCSWDTVVEILKHELAHMIVDEIYGGYKRAPHGDEFKSACYTLGISAKASASDADLGLSLDRRSFIIAKDLEIKNKIKKLFALSESMNEHEANLAMQKAKELAVKYNILSDMDIGKDYDYRFLGEPRFRIKAEDIKICNILNEFFFVEYILVPHYDVKNDRKVTAIEILGLRHNLEMADYVYHFLLKQLDMLWKNHKRIFQVKGKREKKSYLLGILDGFEKTLIISNNPSCSKKEIIILANNNLITYFNYRYPRVRKSRRSGSVINLDTYEHGRKAGKEVVLKRPLKNNSKLIQRFLTKN